MAVPTTRAATPLQVLIVDDRRAVGEAFARAVDLEPDLHCVGVVTSTSALAASPGERVDVVVVDLTAAVDRIVDAVRRIVHVVPGASVIVLADDVTGEFLAAAVRAGAAAVLRRGGSLRDILDAVRTRVRGAVVVDPATLAALPGRAPHPAEAVVLTERERDVLRLMGQGRDPRAIATELQISLHTARGYVKSILAKLGAHTQLEAVVVALRAGLLDRPE